MRKAGFWTTRLVLHNLPTILKDRPHLQRTPVWTFCTLVVSSVVYGYYYVYSTQKKYESMDIYQSSLMHLHNYEPIDKYIGSPIKVCYMEERSVSEEKLYMVIPFKGPKGKAKLIVNAKRGSSDEMLLDHLDIELHKPKKTWTFYIENHAAGPQSAEPNAVGGFTVESKTGNVKPELNSKAKEPQTITSKTVENNSTQTVL